MGDDPYPSLNSMRVGSTGEGASNASGNLNLSITNLGKTNLVILVMAVGLSLGLSVGALMSVGSAREDATRAEREARMLQYYLLELDAKFIKAGLENPADGVAKKLDKQEKQP